VEKAGAGMIATKKSPNRYRCEVHTLAQNARQEPRQYIWPSESSRKHPLLLSHFFATALIRRLGKFLNTGLHGETQGKSIGRDFMCREFFF